MSARSRVRLVVGAVALAAAGGAVAVVLFSDGGGDVGEPAVPPLELAVLVGDDPLTQSLRDAEQAYDRGDREAALEQFEAALVREPESVEAAVGVALAAWPEGTRQRLEDLAREEPESGVVRLHLGLVLFTEGDEEGARRQWRTAEEADPDSPAAVRAESLLHPEMPPGLPFFLPRLSAPEFLQRLDPQAQLDALRERAELGEAMDWIFYGVALQRVDRPLSARGAFDRAVELDPNNVDARTAAAVSRFDKDDPAEAFSRLGPLAGENPDVPVVHFHLGLLLLWLGQVEESRRELTTARNAGPTSVYGREAGRLLSRLEEVRTS